MWCFIVSCSFWHLHPSDAQLYNYMPIVQLNTQNCLCIQCWILVTNTWPITELRAVTFNYSLGRFSTLHPPPPRPLRFPKQGEGGYISWKGRPRLSLTDWHIKTTRVFRELKITSISTNVKCQNNLQPNQSRNGLNWAQQSLISSLFFFFRWAPPIYELVYVHPSVWI